MKFTTDEVARRTVPLSSIGEKIPKINPAWRRGLALAAVCGCAFSMQAADVLIRGLVKREVFPNQTRAAVLNNTAGAPSSVTYRNSFESPVNEADNYAQRLSGFFIPDTTGNYVFYLASDDDGDLFLSTDANPANKRLIAQEAGYSGSRNWNTIGGGASTVEQKRSDYFTPDQGVTFPFMSGIPLVAGTQYYIEAVSAEGGGGDNLAATFRLYDEFDPDNGAAPRLTGNLIGVSIPAPTSLTITNQPQNTTAYSGTTARLTVGASTDSQVPPAYQWTRNGTNLPGATGSSYTFVASPADNSATYAATVSVSGITNTTSTATLTVPATGAVTVPGIKQTLWDNVSRAAVNEGRVGAPTFVRRLESFEGPTDWRDNYTQRLNGYFTPVTSGNYVFFVNSDDSTDLFLSTDASPANKRLIAQETQWSPARAWTTVGGGEPSQKRSDTWTPDQGATYPWASGIPLVAGTQYYIEAVHAEGTSGDNLAVTFKLETEADPVDGDASRLTGDLVSFATSPVSTLEITQQPHNVTVAEAGATNFTVRVQTDSELTPTYQWRTNGVAIASGTNQTLNIANAGLPLNNLQYSVVVGLPGFTNTVTSANATLTVETGVLAFGFLKREIWAGANRAAVNNGTVGISTNVQIQTSGETPINIADSYASRVSGFFIPPSNGNYVFFLASDDDTDLFLSTDENPVNKKLIAQEAGWSGSRAWSTVGGTSTPENKRSDMFINSEWPTPNVITLVSGQRYYIEAAHGEGGGGDHVHITFKLDTEEDPADGTATRMTGSNIAFLAPEAAISFTQHPQNVTAAQSATATFSAAASTTSPFPQVAYQWLRNGQPIEGATSATYTTGLLTLADNDAQISVRASGPGATSVTSQAATITVSADAVPPQVVSAGALTGGTTVGVLFSELLDPASAANAANYTVSGATVSAATLRGGNFVELTLDSAVGANFTVTVSNVRDLAGNNVTGGPTTGAISTMQAADLGFPSEPGFVVPAGNSFFVSAGGLDLWGNQDSGFFAYRQFNGAFDIRARVDSLIGGDEWGKAALMARESLEAGSRNEAVLVTKPAPFEGDASASTTPSRGGVGWINHQWRNTTDEASESLPDAQRVVMTGFPQWIRLVRPDATSNEMISYVSADGASWTQLTSHTTAGAVLPASLYVGMAATAHDDTFGYPRAEVVYSNFSLEAYEEEADANLRIARTGGQVTISWDSGTLESSSTVDGDYTAVGNATSPYNVPTEGQARFFRVRN